MKIAVTGSTGFLGRYIVNHLLERGHTCRCWHRVESDRDGYIDDGEGIEWQEGELNSPEATIKLVRGVDAVVHCALQREGSSFRGAEGELVTFIEKNIVGSIRLMLAAKDAGSDRFLFISTCAVHEVILDDRKLDEAHPLWPTSHYGAHKAAIEKFVHSFGLGGGFNVCSLRPTGIYGLARPVERSKWYDLIRRVQAGDNITSTRGGKEVHAVDVAKAVELLINTPAQQIRGQAFNCCDMYIADETVAKIAAELTGSKSDITTTNKGPKHQIDTTKLQSLGMVFGGDTQLKQTIKGILNTL